MRNVTRWTLTWAVAMTTLSAAPAHAVTAALCVKATLKGPIKMRADAPCKPSEIQLGTFDGTTIQLSGVNLQIVSGSGSTNGSVNGTGNLIVGYNEGTCPGSGMCVTDADCTPHTCLGGVCDDVFSTPCSTDADCSACDHSDQTGSHNLVVGPGHRYPSAGGLVAGSLNAVTDENASVTGGEGNTASAPAASVSGGASNLASEYATSVSGGVDNTSSGFYASVSGGDFNTADGVASSVSGGDGLTVNASDGWAAGSTGSASGPASFFSY